MKNQISSRSRLAATLMLGAFALTGVGLSIIPAQSQDLAAASIRVSYEPGAYPGYSEHHIETVIHNGDWFVSVLWGKRWAHLEMYAMYWDFRNNAWNVRHSQEIDRWQIDTLFAGFDWNHTSYTSGYALPGDWFYYRVRLDAGDATPSNDSRQTSWMVQPAWLY